jgi:hypothetical protein
LCTSQIGPNEAKKKYCVLQVHHKQDHIMVGEVR